jgi:chemotaxis protein MotB
MVEGVSNDLLCVLENARKNAVKTRAGRVRAAPPGRRRKIVEAVNRERWVISYADFVTLLFAFFVVLFASSEANTDKAKRVSEAVENALSGGVNSHTHARAEADLTSSLRLLENQLEPEIRAGMVRMSLQQRGLVVTLSDAGFFKPGDDTIEPRSYPAFEKLARALRKLPNPIRLEGHTDSAPIHTARFRSNWDLSTARSLAVLTLLEETYAIGRGRLSAAGYADTVPVEPNETESGKAHNRRVDLVILSGSGMAGQPGARPHGL